MKSQMHGHNGFSLIELMIVVVIIGLLAALALPAYQDYSVRAKMSEVVLAASACRTAITEGYQRGGSAPSANGWGCETNTSQFVAGIATTADGAILVTVSGSLTSALAGKRLALVPLVDGAAATAATHLGRGINGWRCGSPTDGTTVPANQLPSSCRD